MRIAATGHRSERCKDEEAVRRKLRETLESAPKDTVIISGMANGWDLWAGSEALALGYEIWAAKPWKGHTARVEDAELYAQIIEASSRVINVVDSEEFPGNWAYQKRNEWMVDNATNILAYWDGVEKGGTWNCIKYARGKKPIRNVYV